MFAKSPYDPRDVAFPEKTRAARFSAPLCYSAETVWLLLAHNKMIIFILSSTLRAFDAQRYLSIWKLTDSATVVTLPLQEDDEADLHLRQRDQRKLWRLCVCVDRLEQQWETEAVWEQRCLRFVLRERNKTLRGRALFHIWFSLIKAFYRPSFWNKRD